ncbi:hypothetical protein BDK88_2255 [Natrinema hispanicum]|uniref:DUF8055 domain-containing protein n=1 Tax=Natrinema hispanicum TaxID=392421 RepID=A0A482Y789_9EURY|nr:hypothetical protein [Natrinema hispanicum]RZV11023.1 hypothetical protein BDK88_2255 [Natrinema hispanicum]
MSRYGPQIAALARRAERERAAFDAVEVTVGSGSDPIPDGPTSPDNAVGYLRAGAGQAIWLYIEARTGGRLVPFSDAEFTALETAMNRWLECYTRCHGVALEAEFSVREAAELLLETRNIVDTAQLLTCVPARRARQQPTQ